MFRIWSIGNSTTADTMVVVPRPINQYPIQKRFLKFSNTVFLWVLEAVSSPYIIRSNPSFHHIHPLNKYQINTFHTIPSVSWPIPATPGIFHQNTPISSTKMWSHGRVLTKWWKRECRDSVFGHKKWGNISIPRNLKGSDVLTMESRNSGLFVCVCGQKK